MWRRKYAGLNAAGIARVKTLQRKISYLKFAGRQLAEDLKIARTMIKRLVPISRQRSTLAAAIRAKYRVSLTRANRIVALTAKAGKCRKNVCEGDQRFIAAVREYLTLHPTSGFRTAISLLFKGMPGSRRRALTVMQAAVNKTRHRGQCKDRSVGSTPGLGRPPIMPILTTRCCAVPR